MNTLPESQVIQSWTLNDEHITRESDYAILNIKGW
jgi:hypothetical protein